MYYTYRYKKRPRQINIDDVLNSLFEGVDYQEPVDGVNAVYKDLTYPRFRTIVVSPTNLTEDQQRATTNYIHKIKILTEQMEYWLLQHQADMVYHEFKIPKATGGFREIKAPGDILKTYMREVKGTLEHIGVLPHDSAFAYIKERDCKKALERHQDHHANWFLKLDISGFFNHCSPDFIKRQLRLIYPFTLMEDSCYNRFVDAICQLACVDNELPQGTPLSPIITNSIMIPIDYKINKLLNELVEGGLLPKQRYIYTRYADDIIISAKTKFNYELVISYIEDRIFKDTPLKFNKTKTRFATSSGRNWNLGVMCNSDNQTTIGYRKKNIIKRCKWKNNSLC